MYRATGTNYLLWTEGYNEDVARERILHGQVLRLRDHSPLEALRLRDVPVRPLWAVATAVACNGPHPE